MVVWVLLFLAWTSGLQKIPSSVTDFPHSHKLLCVTAHLENGRKRPFISQALQTGTVPPTEYVRNQFKGLDNPPDFSNRKAELRIKLIKLKAV